ncbi:hypothetical protein [Dactylosporangium salmoneum]|uniref:SGNH/GDSL hydrolase family protein n=1 Tax=Dactylosporangium salmoneum TaxID=53361 RepID=A0ABP5ULZ6_9ACTN
MSYRHRIIGAVLAAGLLAGAGPGASAGVPAVVGRVEVVNSATHRPVLGLSPLTDGTVVDLSRLAGIDLGLHAEGAPAFTVTGPDGDTHECADSAGCAPLHAPGPHTLTVAGAPLSVRFTVTATAGTGPALDVLFVGNSLLGTINHGSGENTPNLVRHLASAAGRALNVTEVIHSGYTLRQTWNDGLVTKALGGAKRYDFIVLQEYSTLVATNPAAARDTLLDVYGPRFERALKPGGRVVLFKNWALADPAPFPSRAAAKRAIDANYAALSAALPTPNLLAPIGDEFETVIAGKGVSYLIVPDGKHPNDTAIYLDAVTLYGILFRESPRDLADLYVPAPDAAELRSVAASAIGY